MKNTEYTDRLLNMIEEGVSPYHVVEAVQESLLDAGFEPLRMKDDWGLDYGGKYFVKYHDSALIAFTVGSKMSYFPEIRMTACHTDFPGLRIKPNPDIASGGYMKLNVEVYGGPILNTFLDRPLSIAGRVALKGEDVFHPRMKLVNFKRPLLTIPNLAIHMNRDVNKGVELNRQTQMLPVLTLIDETLNKDGYFMSLLADEIGTDPEEILDYELYIYNTDTGDYIGAREEMLSAPRLDDLTAVSAILSGIMEEKNTQSIHIAAFLNDEEIGSRTKTGAASPLLSIVAERIFTAFSLTRERFFDSLEDAILLSVDVAHGEHPNYPEKNDVTNKAVLGKGFVIKEACAQTYATDSIGTGILLQIAETEHIPCQRYVNRSDIAGGSTLGAVAAGHLPVRIVDVGVPILAMHSARELMAVSDQKAMTDLVRAFYSL